MKIALCLCLLSWIAVVMDADGGTPLEPKPVPKMQAVPQPYDQVSFRRDGTELTRYHFRATLNRPFLYPVIGPSGRPLTRMGHPHDPIGHSHHNSVWTSHHDVNGSNFWADRQGTRIAHRRLARLDDGPDHAALLVHNAWLAKDGKALLNERRRVAVHDLPEGEWLLVVDLELASAGGDVTLGKTPFGVFAVRMAKTVGVHDGGGMIRNSEGGVNEKAIFWKRARWVDYSGAVADGVLEGLTLLDHPANPNHPSHFHVRNDGWMGSSLTFDGPRTIAPGKPLRLRYGLYVHAGVPDPARLEARWDAFAKMKPWDGK